MPLYHWMCCGQLLSEPNWGEYRWMWFLNIFLNVLWEKREPIKHRSHVVSFATRRAVNEWTTKFPGDPMNTRRRRVQRSSPGIQLPWRRRRKEVTLRTRIRLVALLTSEDMTLLLIIIIMDLKWMRPEFRFAFPFFSVAGILSSGLIYHLLAFAL